MNTIIFESWWQSLPTWRKIRALTQTLSLTGQHPRRPLAGQHDLLLPAEQQMTPRAALQPLELLPELDLPVPEGCEMLLQRSH